jgi:hypothetical protein
VETGDVLVAATYVLIVCFPEFNRTRLVDSNNRLFGLSFVGAFLLE